MCESSGRCVSIEADVGASGPPCDRRVRGPISRSSALRTLAPAGRACPALPRLAIRVLVPHTRRPSAFDLRGRFFRRSVAQPPSNGPLKKTERTPGVHFAFQERRCGEYARPTSSTGRQPHAFLRRERLIRARLSHSASCAAHTMPDPVRLKQPFSAVEALPNGLPTDTIEVAFYHVRAVDAIFW